MRGKLFWDATTLDNDDGKVGTGGGNAEQSGAQAATDGENASGGEALDGSAVSKAIVVEDINKMHDVECEEDGECGFLENGHAVECETNKNVSSPTIPGWLVEGGHGHFVVLQ